MSWLSKLITQLLLVSNFALVSIQKILLVGLLEAFEEIDDKTPTFAWFCIVFVESVLLLLTKVLLSSCVCEQDKINNEEEVTKENEAIFKNKLVFVHIN